MSKKGQSNFKVFETDSSIPMILVHLVTLCSEDSVKAKQLIRVQVFIRNLEILLYTIHLCIILSCFHLCRGRLPSHQ